METGWRGKKKKCCKKGWSVLSRLTPCSHPEKTQRWKLGRKAGDNCSKEITPKPFPSMTSLATAQTSWASFPSLPCPRLLFTQFRVQTWLSTLSKIGLFCFYFRKFTECEGLITRTAPENTMSRNHPNSLPEKVLQNYFSRSCTANTSKHLCHDLRYFISIMLKPTILMRPVVCMLFGHNELKITDIRKPRILVQSKHQPIVQTEPKGQDSLSAVLHKDAVFSLNSPKLSIMFSLLLCSFLTEVKFQKHGHILVCLLVFSKYLNPLALVPCRLAKQRLT